jgi:hypothetical protein
MIVVIGEDHLRRVLIAADHHRLPDTTINIVVVLLHHPVAAVEVLAGLLLREVVADRPLSIVVAYLRMPLSSIVTKKNANGWKNVVANARNGRPNLTFFLPVASSIRWLWPVESSYIR